MFWGVHLWGILALRNHFFKKKGGSRSRFELERVSAWSLAPLGDLLSGLEPTWLVWRGLVLASDSFAWLSGSLGSSGACGSSHRVAHATDSRCLSFVLVFGSIALGFCGSLLSSLVVASSPFVPLPSLRCCFPVSCSSSCLYRWFVCLSVCLSVGVCVGWLVGWLVAGSVGLLCRCGGFRPVPFRSVLLLCVVLLAFGPSPVRRRRTRCRPPAVRFHRR